MKLFQTCYFPALKYSLEAWTVIKKEEIKEIENLQSKVFKGIFKFPITAISAGIWMEIWIWPAEQKIK